MMNSQNEMMQGLSVQAFSHRVLKSAGLAFVLSVIFMPVFLFFGSVLTGQTFWQGLWHFFPLITVTIAGAFGGMVYYLMVQIWGTSPGKRILAVIASVLIYIVLLWLGLVAGLSVTGLWN